MPPRPDSPPPPDPAPSSPLRQWIEHRRALVADLAQALRDGFQAVAAFKASAYLDCVERQDELTQRIAALDRRRPDLPPAGPERAWAAAELERMNAEMKELAGLHAALIEHAGRSVRSFQRVWALGAPGYDPPEKKK